MPTKTKTRAGTRQTTRSRKKPAKKPRRIRGIHLHLSLAALLLIAAIIFIGVGISRNRHVDAGPPQAPANKTWKMVWNDEFNGPNIDTSKWNVQNNSNYGAGNREDHCYMANNVSVGGGSLRLSAQRQTVNCGGSNPDTGNNTYYFTSGMVTTRAQGGAMKYKFKQGYAEARVKAPKGNPYWPAFWLVSPNDGSTPGWPDYGEFDIFELYGARPDVTNGAFHYKCTKGNGHCKTAPTWYNLKTDSSYGGSSTLGTHITNQAALNAYSGGTTDFNVYGFLWEADKISWFVNGRKYRYFDGTNLYRIEQNGSQTLEATTAAMGEPAIPFSTVFAYDHSIIFNLAVGGDGPRYQYYGYTGYDTAQGYVDGNYAADNPGTMEVDYVRVYQLADASTTNPPSNGGQNPGGTNPPTGGSGGSQQGGDTPGATNNNQGGSSGAPKVASEGTPVGGNVVLNPQLQQGGEAVADVVKVEYYVNGELFSTLEAPPFQLDTTMLKNGTYQVTEKVYYKDGTQTETTTQITIENVAATIPQPEPLLTKLWKHGWPVVVITAVLGGMFAYPPTRAIMLWPVRRWRQRPIKWR